MISRWQLQRAVQLVCQGGVIAYPTEAVWGLGCLPGNQQAVQRILDIKQRPMHKGLILVAATIEQLDWLLQGLTTEQLQQLNDSWPGPNTWLIPHRGRVPRWISGRHASVAVRVSDHPLVQELCRLTGPLVSTSANPTKHPAATSRLHVEQYFQGQLDAVLNAPLGNQQQPSTIRDLLTGQVVR